MSIQLEGGLYWREPVETVADLPTDAIDSEARFILSDDTCFVFVEGAWVQFMSPGNNLVSPEPVTMYRSIVCCSGCGADVAPEAKRCQHCRAFLG